MSAPDEKLCERCKQRPATHHVCFGGTGESNDLCEACFRASSSPEVLASSDRFTEALRKGRCKYCGAPAVCGCGGSIPFAEDSLDLWCEACRQDLVEFGNMPENAIPDFPFEDKAAQERVRQQHLERERRQEEFMRQRVSQRRGRGNG